LIQKKSLRKDWLPSVGCVRIQ